MLSVSVSVCFALLATPSAPAPAASPSVEGGAALVFTRVVTVDGEDQIHEPGLLLVRDGKLEYVGAPTEIPAGYELHEYDAWATPGQVDLHTHVHTGSFADINDMVRTANVDLRTSPGYVPGNPLLKRACAGGVTTLFGIPGSGTATSGFGFFYKSKPNGSWDSTVVADPGGLKVAQSHNPERRTYFGVTRAGLTYVLEDVVAKAAAVGRGDTSNPFLVDMARILAGELPVLVHCAAGQGVGNTIRLWKNTLDARVILSHGSFNGWKVAEAVAAAGVPVNHGPRTFDWFSSRTGRFEPTAKHYWAAGGPDFSLNTDSSVIPQEELFLQGAMTARQGAPSYAMLQAVTLHPARAAGLDHRVGSLEVGKDADVVITRGNPLDPRVCVEAVWIDGELQYSRQADGQWF